MTIAVRNRWGMTSSPFFGDTVRVSTNCSGIFKILYFNQKTFYAQIFKILDLLVIKDPEYFTNEDYTSILILFNLASCIETGCITFAPSDAISSISSYEITFIFFALFNLFGSVV